MQVVYVNEYQPSSAKVVLGDPIYKKSYRTESIRVAPAVDVVPIALILVLAAGLGLTALALYTA
jgi:hypothetical protein